MSAIEDVKPHQREYNRLLSAQVEAIASGDTSMRQHESGATWWQKMTFPVRMKWWAFWERWRQRPSQAGLLGLSTPHAEELRQAGYSPASNPMPWGEDIARHNAQVSRAYREEILTRRNAMLRGDYQPRFLLCDPLMKISGDTGLVPDDVNWDLEMTLRPNARVNVLGLGKQLPQVTPQEIADIKTEMAARNAVTAAALGAPYHTARAAVGTRAEILAAVGGSETLADQVEQAARDFFGVEDLDAPLPRRADADTGGEVRLRDSEPSGPPSPAVDRG